MWLMWDHSSMSAIHSKKLFGENTWHSFIIEITRIKLGLGFIFFLNVPLFEKGKVT